MPSQYEHLHENFNIEDAAFAAHFDDVLDHLLNRCPVAKSQVGPGYMVFNRYRDVRRIGQDWRTFSSSDGWMMDPPEGNIEILPEDSDPPYHTAWRKVLNPFFTAKAIAELEAPARQYAAQLVDAFVARGRCEYIGQFAAKLPGLILFRHILPVPVADLSQLFDDINTYTFGAPQARVPAFGRVHAYMEAWLAARRDKPPQGDIVDVLLAGVDRDGDECPWQDKVHVALDLVFGGLATTTHAMGVAMAELAHRPAARATLMADARRMRTAVDESIRLASPTVMVARTARRDTQVGNVKIKAGQRVALNYAAASRDPELCDNGRAFDVDRKDMIHTAFGIGPHRCIGEHLARLEIRVAIEAFLRRIPAFSLTADSVPVYESGQLRTMTALHLSWPKPAPP